MEWDVKNDVKNRVKDSVKDSVKNSVKNTVKNSVQNSVKNNAEEMAYHEVSAYTLTRGDRTFIHQHVVDAWAAQHATAQSKPIGVFFALVGLYLHVDRGLTGREVQRAHMQLAKHPEPWPVGELPVDRGTITAIDVNAAPEGAARDAMIDRWCRSVWSAYAASRERVATFVERRGLVPPRA